ncbi:type VII secretion integral membrane protein EccD [Streptacidiphilus sp. EB129]|uniref:type VII secretion integral membrane protein EccD n=1 Tax=Streptacidiphilus sp. EB129 TaxID=3156262 RepID=UPI003518FBE6
MTNDLCRLVLVTPDRSLDVAVPVDVPISYLLPTLLKHAGAHLAEEGAEHEGWVLQRLGEEPLDEETTVAACALHDGERLYFRPRRESLPAIDFDDLVAGLAGGIKERADRWTPALTRWLFLGLLGAALAAGVAVLLLPGPSAPRAVAAGSVALLLLLAACALGRAYDDAPAALLLGCAALPYAAVGGLLAIVPRPHHGPGSTAELGAATAVLLTAVLAAVLTGSHVLVYLGAGTAALFGVLGGLVATFFTIGGAQTGACVLVVALALNPAVPMLSFRLGGLRVPPLPSGPEQLLQHTSPLPAAELGDRARAVDGFQAALFLGVGAACAGALTALGHDAGWGARVVLGTGCAALLLRSRLLGSAWQRLGLLLPAAYGLATLGVRLAAGASAHSRLGIGLAVVLAVALLLLALSRSLPERPMLPYWGRTAEILEILTAVALVPMAAGLLGVFGWAHGLAA